MTKQDTTTVKKWKITLVGWFREEDKNQVPDSEVHYVEAIFKQDAISIAKERSAMVEIETIKGTTFLKQEDWLHFQNGHEEVEKIQQAGKEQAMNNYREYEKEREARILAYDKAMDTALEEFQELNREEKTLALSQVVNAPKDKDEKIQELIRIAGENGIVIENFTEEETGKTVSTQVHETETERLEMVKELLKKLEKLESTLKYVVRRVDRYVIKGGNDEMMEVKIVVSEMLDECKALLPLVGWKKKILPETRFMLQDIRDMLEAVLREEGE